MSATRANIGGPGENNHDSDSSSSDNDSDSDSSGGVVSGSETEEEGDESTSTEDDDSGEEGADEEEMEDAEESGYTTVSLTAGSDREMEDAVSGGGGGESLGSELRGEDIQGEEEDREDDRSVITLRRSPRKRKQTTVQPPLLSDDDEDPADLEDDSGSDFAQEEKCAKKAKLGPKPSANGKFIYPPLEGSELLPSPYYCVYLMRAATGHWYIGFSNRPWTRLREHNGYLRPTGSNLGAHTMDPAKRPWRQMCLVEGFENNIAAQGFEGRWRAQHPRIEEDDTSNARTYVNTLINLLHQEKAARVLIDIRFFDFDSAQAWKVHEATGGCYRPAPLLTIDNVHADQPGWDANITTSRSKNHPLQCLKREVEDYSLHLEQFIRGRKLITESNIAHECTVCNLVIGENDGRGETMVEHGTDGQIEGTALIVLCPAAGCEAVSHMTCLANNFFKGEVKRGGAVDYRNVLVPKPISGNCPSCNVKTHWRDYTREMNWRMQASHESWQKIWSRQKVIRSARRTEQEAHGKASKRATRNGQPKPPGLKASVPPRPPPRPAVLIGGRRMPVDSVTSDQRDMNLAIQKMMLSQEATGDIRKPTWYEKALRGDVICLERFHEWATGHIDNEEIVRWLPPKDETTEERITLRDIEHFFDASSICCAYYESSRTYGTDQVAVEFNKEGWRHKVSGKGIFKYNDTQWMAEDNDEKRGSMSLLGLMRPTRLGGLDRTEEERLKEAAEKRRLRLARHKALQPIYRAQRDIENEAENERQRLIRKSKMRLKRLGYFTANGVTSPQITQKLQAELAHFFRLKAGDAPRRKIMECRGERRRVMSIERDKDRANAEKRRLFRRVWKKRRQYCVWASKGAQSGRRHSLVQRKMPEKRVRPTSQKRGANRKYTLEFWFPSSSERSSFVSLPSDAENNEDEDMEDHDDIDLPSSSTSPASNRSQSIFSRGESVESSASSDEDIDGSGTWRSVTHSDDMVVDTSGA